MNPQLVLDEIADAILDGTPVDWSRVDLDDTIGDNALVAQLKTVESLRLSRTRDTATPSGGWSWGQLRVFERIGNGAYGEVYRAWDTRLDREIALKLLPANDPDAVPSDSVVIEEGRLLARVRHPNVVTIFGAERIDGRVGLWMELVKGQTLEEALRSGRKFEPEEATRLGIDLCRAVSAVHAAGLLHRDIKTQNIMLDDSGRLVLMDFGTGRELDATDRHVAGTPLYLAPEVLAGGAATPQSDTYSIGVVLFRLLTHTYPVRGADLADLRRAHAAGAEAGAPVDRAEIPQGLRRVIARALDADPARRYAGVDEMATALAAGGRPPRRQRGAIAWVVVAAIVLAFAGGWNLGLSQVVRPMLAAVGLARTPSIAVLPFTDNGSDPGSQAFINGLTIEVIDRLGHIDGLHPTSLQSSFYFQDRPRDLREVKKRLSVDFVVEAAVRRVGNRIQIRAKLVRTSDDVPVWSGDFDRTTDDVLAIRDDIALAIVNKLRLTLGAGQRRYQLSAAATDLYLRGLAAVARGGIESAREAVQLFDQVIMVAPEFAPAHAGLAEAYAEWSWQLDGLTYDEGLAGMWPAALRALDLDPLLPQAHAAMGLVHARELRWDDAKKSFERALDSPEILTGIRTSYAISTLVPLGEAAAAERLLTAAIAVDRLSPELLRDLGNAQFAGGRFKEAIQSLTQALEIDPSVPYAANLLARALTFDGRPGEAIALWESRRFPGNWELWLLPAYIREGRQQDVDRLVGADRSQKAFRQARVYAAFGDKDRTFDALSRAIDDVPHVPHRVAFLLACPEMAFLRGDSRLGPLRARLNLR